MKVKNLFLTLVIAVCLSTVGVYADTMTIPLNITQVAYGLPSPWATITLTDITGGVQVSVDLSTDMGLMAKQHNRYTLGFSTAVAGITLANSPADFTINPKNTYQVADFGDVTYTINYNPPRKPIAGGCAGNNDCAYKSDFTFDLMASGLDINDFVKSDAQNPYDVLFVADLINVGSGTGAGLTGYVGGNPSPVPEPTTLLLLGSGLAAICLSIRRKIK
jgi:hypothetical protein